MYLGEFYQSEFPTPFVGREKELSRLEKAMEQAREGGQLVVLQGEIGIGRTRLAEEFAIRAAARGARVLWGQWCDYVGERLPRRFCAFGAEVCRDNPEVVFSEVIIGPDDLPRLGSRIRGWIQSLNHLPPLARTGAPPAPLDIDRGFGTNPGPLLLIVDDLRGSDRLSLVLLRTLARALRPIPSLLLGICESGELAGPDFESILGDLVAEPDRITLQGLSEEEIARLLALTTGEPVDNDALAGVYRVCRGNPQVMTKVISLLRAHHREPSASADYPIRNGAGGASSSAVRIRTADDVGRSNGNLLTREGDYWTVVFRGSVLRLRHVKGLTYIAHLLYQPYQQVHALQLVALEHGDMGCNEQTSDPYDPAFSKLGLAFQRDTGPMLDWRAKEAYARRLKDLDEELREATGFNDLGRITKLQDERSFITGEISRSIGLRGRDRKGSSPAERARVSVTHAIKAAIRKIATGQPDLAHHLSIAIRTGLYCAYLPEQIAERPWQ